MIGKYSTNINNISNLIHRLPAGMMEGDFSTEMFGERETKKVYAVSNGKTISFEEMNPILRAQVFEKMLNDEKAIKSLKHLPQKEAVEHYTFCIYGAADSTADFSANGILQEGDNFICSDNCICLNWNSKKMKIDGEILTPKQLAIAQLLATDLCDKQIADKLNICVSTLDTHKKNCSKSAMYNQKQG